MSGLWRRKPAPYESLEAHPKTDEDRGGPSMIIDPADGKVPYQPWALARVEYNAKHYLHHHAACLLSDVPDSMYQDNVYQFVQSPQRLMILWQKMHGWRMVSLDGTPFLPSAIRLWRGDSRGTWDGNTLVIETINQTGIPWLDQRGRFVTSDVRVVERFSMIDANTIHYTATVTDANVLTRPFTMAMALRRETNPHFEILEEACHESNEFTMSQMMRIGYRLFPGISPEEARAAARKFSSGR